MIARHRIAFLALALVGAALDLVSKNAVFAKLSLGQEYEVIAGFFYYGCTTNSGIVFGWFQGGGPIFLVISILAVPIIVWIYWRVKSPIWVMTASLGLILAGTLGNLYDRVSFGHVRDFLKFQFGSYVWPLFNIADSCICVGVVLLSIEMLFFEEKKQPVPLPAGGGVPEGPTDKVPTSTPLPGSAVPDTGPTEIAPTVGQDTAPIPRPDEQSESQTKES